MGCQASDWSDLSWPATPFAAPALAAAQVPHKLPRQSAAQMGMTVTTPLVGPNKAIVWPEPQNVRLAPLALCGVARPNPSLPSVHHREKREGPLSYRHLPARPPPQHNHSPSIFCQSMFPLHARRSLPLKVVKTNVVFVSIASHSNKSRWITKSWQRCRRRSVSVRSTPRLPGSHRGPVVAAAAESKSAHSVSTVELKLPI